MKQGKEEDDLLHAVRGINSPAKGFFVTANARLSKRKGLAMMVQNYLLFVCFSMEGIVAKYHV